MAAATRTTTKAPAKKPVVETSKAQAEREFQKRTEPILDLLGDKVPHTRAEIGELAARIGLSDSELGRIKAHFKIAHVRIQQGEGGRSRFAWVISSK